jgi:hypothetical protein
MSHKCKTSTKGKNKTYKIIKTHYMLITSTREEIDKP